jgi:hypothetical protein
LPENSIRSNTQVKKPTYNPESVSANGKQLIDSFERLSNFTRDKDKKWKRKRSFQHVLACWNSSEENTQNIMLAKEKILEFDYEKIYYHSKKETGPLVFKINNSDLVFIVSPYKDEELENNQLLITCY